MSPARDSASAVVEALRSRGERYRWFRSHIDGIFGNDGGWWVLMVDGVKLMVIPVESGDGEWELELPAHEPEQMEMAL